MNLVNELQISAGRDDVLTVLRNTKRLASKLGRQDIAEWLESERNGYEKGKPVPEYRMVRGTLAMYTNGYIPAGFGYLMNGLQDVPEFGINPVVPMIEPISYVLSLLEAPDRGHAICLPLDRSWAVDKQVRQHVNPMFRNQVTFLLRFNEAQVKGIPEGIKDKVLDWACVLEEAGVKGEDQTFKDEEIRVGHTITFNINGSHIDQLNNLGTNIKGTI